MRTFPYSIRTLKRAQGCVRVISEVAAAQRVSAQKTWLKPSDARQLGQVPQGICDQQPPDTSHHQVATAGLEQVGGDASDEHEPEWCGYELESEAGVMRGSDTESKEEGRDQQGCSVAEISWAAPCRIHKQRDRDRHQQDRSALPELRNYAGIGRGHCERLPSDGEKARVVKARPENPETRDISGEQENEAYSASGRPYGNRCAASRRRYV